MTTKEQERKALAQIRKIVEGLGENSYIGTAFEGCFEIAESNIENDFACSIQQQLNGALDICTKRLEEITSLKEKIAKLTDEKNQEIKNRQSYAAEAQKQANRAATLEEKLEALAKIHDEVTYDARKQQDILNEKDAEIIRLKARLFDLMDK